MYINLDVVMRLVLIGLVVAGIGALITLAMLFKNLIQTMHSLTGALDLLQRDLAKLEGPLDTVDALSTTVNEIQTSAKRAANTAIDTFSTSSQRIMNWVDAKTSIKDSSHAPEPEAKPESKDQHDQKNDHHEDHSSQSPEADFKPIKPKEAQEQPETAASEPVKVDESQAVKPQEDQTKPEPAATSVPLPETAKSETEDNQKPDLPDPVKESISLLEDSGNAELVEEVMIGIPRDEIHPNEALVVNTVENLDEDKEGLSSNEIEENKE